MSPLLLLDVDGVLNAFDRNGPGLRSGTATAYGSTWRIGWRQEVVDRLVAWHVDGALELRWLTTWGHEANAELAALLGVPHLAVAGTHLDEPAGGGTGGDGLAAATPSAPGEQRWWKHDVVQRLLVSEPGRLLIWVDDELRHPTRFRRWADAEPRVLPVGPVPETGLSDDDLALIGSLL